MNTDSLGEFDFKCGQAPANDRHEHDNAIEEGSDSDNENVSEQGKKKEKQCSKTPGSRHLLGSTIKPDFWSLIKISTYTNYGKLGKQKNRHKPPSSLT